MNLFVLGVHTHMPWLTCGGQGQFVGVSSHLLLCRSRSGHQMWWHVHLPTAVTYPPSRLTDLSNRYSVLLMLPRHKSGVSGNLEMLERSHEVLPLRERGKESAIRYFPKRLYMLNLLVCTVYNIYSVLVLIIFFYKITMPDLEINLYNRYVGIE